MGFVGLIMFIVGLMGLKREYFGEKWQRGFSRVDQTEQSEDPSADPDKWLERHLHYGIISIWGCVLIGPLIMLLSPWDCSGF